MPDSIQDQSQGTARERIIERDIDIHWSDLPRDTQEELKSKIGKELTESAPIEHIILDCMRSEIESDFESVIQSAVLEGAKLVTATVVFAVIALFFTWYGFQYSLPSASFLGMMLVAVIFYQLWRLQRGGV